MGKHTCFYSNFFIVRMLRFATIIFPNLLPAQSPGSNGNAVRLLPTSNTALRFPATIVEGQELDVSMATYNKYEVDVVKALGADLTLAVWTSLNNKDYPEGMDNIEWRFKNAEFINGNNKTSGYTCTRMCLLNKGFTSLIKIEAAANQDVKKTVRPKKDFYAFIWSQSLLVKKDYNNTNVTFGTRARILGTGIGAALNNPFNRDYMRQQLYETLYFLDTPSIQKIIERSAPAAMPAAIATSYNYGFTKYKGNIYNGYALGVIYGNVLMCIPAKENYHITSLCLRPYEDIYLLLQASEVELDDGTGSIALLNSEYPFDCSQLVSKPAPISHGKPMHAVTKVLKNQTTACPVCVGRGKVFYADGYKKEYLNMTYQTVSQQYSSKRCNYCNGAGYLHIPDVTVEVYVED